MHDTDTDTDTEYFHYQAQVHDTDHDTDTEYIHSQAQVHDTDTDTEYIHSQAKVHDTDTDTDTEYAHYQAHAGEGGQRPGLLGRLSKVRPRNTVFVVAQRNTITSSVCVVAHTVKLVPNGNPKYWKLWALGAEKVCTHGRIRYNPSHLPPRKNQ